MRLTTLSIRSAILLAVALLLLVVGGFGILTIAGASRASRRLAETQFYTDVLLSSAYEMEINLEEVGLDVVAYALSGNPRHLATLNDDDADFAQHLATFMNKAHATTHQRVGEQIQVAYRDYIDAGRRVVASRRDASTGLDAGLLQFLARRDRLDVLLDEELQIVLAQESEGTWAAARTATQRIAPLIGLSTGAILVIGILGLWHAHRKIAAPLGQLTQLTGVIAAGELPPPVQPSSCLEVAQLQAAIGTMAAAVVTTEDALRRLNGDLDDLVRARTAALEQALRQVQEESLERVRLAGRLHLAERRAAVDTMAASVAHDINNLLAIVVPSCELALGELPHGETHCRAYVEGILVAAQQSTSLIDRLMSTAGGSQRFVPELVDLAKLVDSSEAILRAAAEPHRLILDLQPNLPMVSVDPLQFGRVLLNLVVNARDAMSAGEPGTVRIESASMVCPECRTWTSGTVEPGPYVLLTVTDTGCGMAQDTLASALEPYFSTKSRERGTGLGLSVSYGVVAQSGGHMHLTSTPGAGTTVAVALPALAGEPIDDGGRPAGHDPTGRRTDDDTVASTCLALPLRATSSLPMRMA